METKHQNIDVEDSYVEVEERELHRIQSIDQFDVIQENEDNLIADVENNYEAIEEQY